MKIDEIFEQDKDKDKDEFPNLRDLSKHQYSIRILVPKDVIDKIDDEQFEKLLIQIESDKTDDFIVWHNWENNYYYFDVAGTKSFQVTADATKFLRDVLKSKDHDISFSHPMNIRNLNDLAHMRYFSASEVKVKL